MRTQDVAIVLFAYNRPDKLRQTLSSLRVAIGELISIAPSAADIPVIVALDGPRSREVDRRAAARPLELDLVGQRRRGVG